MDIDGNIITSGTINSGISVTKTNYTRNSANTATVTNIITIVKGSITGWTP